MQRSCWQSTCGRSKYTTAAPPFTTQHLIECSAEHLPGTAGAAGLGGAVGALPLSSAMGTGPSAAPSAGVEPVASCWRAVDGAEPMAASPTTSALDSSSSSSTTAGAAREAGREWRGNISKAVIVRSPLLVPTGSFSRSWCMQSSDRHVQTARLPACAVTKQEQAKCRCAAAAAPCKALPDKSPAAGVAAVGSSGCVMSHSMAASMLFTAMRQSASSTRGCREHRP